MSIWTLAEVFFWAAVAAPWVLGALGLLVVVPAVRRVRRAERQVMALLQESPLADPDPLDDDVSDDDHQYADEHAEMWWRSAAIDAAPLIPTQPGSDKAALDICTAIWDQPARTEENQ